MDTDRPGPLAQNSEKQPATAPVRAAGKKTERLAEPRPVRGRAASRRSAGLRPDKALVRRLVTEAFARNRPAIEKALTRCFTNPKTVLACVELLAKLEGELS